MKVLIVDCTYSGDEAFNEPLIKAFSKLADTHARKLSDIKSQKDVFGYDAMIISGVPITYPYKLAKTTHKPIKYAVKLDIPILGICLGHEGIGTFYGAKLITAREKVDGAHKINTEPKDPIFYDMPSSFSSRELHEASITLPKKFELVATSNKCRNMGMKHKSKPIYGLQFHPEFKPKRLNIFSNFIEICNEYKKHKELANNKTVTEPLFAKTL